MDEFSTEEEQLESVKKWLKENGPSIAIGLVLGASAIFGGRAWIGYQDQQAAEAGVGFAQIIEAIADGNMELVRERGSLLVKEYSNTPYAALAAMAMAKGELKDNNVSVAEEHLKWAVEHAEPKAFQHVARQRLIRILLAGSKLEEAGKLLDEAASIKGVQEYFRAGYTGLQGDLYMAQGSFSEASRSYQAAIRGLPPGSPIRKLMTLKEVDSKQSFAREQP